jgi:VWFA-related protein
MLGRLCCFAAIVSFCVTAPAQTPAPETNATSATTTTATLSVEARLVIVPVTVRDKKYALMTGLPQSAFALSVDGKPQTIRYFDHDSNVPLTLGLLVDTSRSQTSVLDDERTASSAFLQTMLAPDNDKAFVLQFAGQAELLQDVTASRPLLQQALKELDTTTTSQRADPDTDSGNTGSNGSGGRGHHVGGGTALYDAVYLASREVIAKQPGRRAFILLTDGVDNGSHETIASSIESAQRANTVLYAIYYKGEEHHDNGGGGHHGGGGFPGGGGHSGGGFPGGGGGYPGGGGGGRGSSGGGGYHHDVDGLKILERMCGETGGTVYIVSKKETVDKIYTEIAAELRQQYRLGFTPNADAAGAGYHQLAVTLTIPDSRKDTVQTRDGYYTSK